MSAITRGGGNNPFNLKKNSSSKKVLASSIRNSNDLFNGRKTLIERNRSDERIIGKAKNSISNIKFGAYEDQDADNFNLR